jgi:hypothetical protein
VKRRGESRVERRNTLKNIKVVSGNEDLVEFLRTSKRSEFNETDLKKLSRIDSKRTWELNWKFSVKLRCKKLVWKDFKM